jgi:hypothetical protein
MTNSHVQVNFSSPFAKTHRLIHSCSTTIPFFLRNHDFPAKKQAFPGWEIWENGIIFNE